MERVLMIPLPLFLDQNILAEGTAADPATQGQWLKNSAGACPHHLLTLSKQRPNT